MKTALAISTLLSNSRWLLLCFFCSTWCFIGCQNENSNRNSGESGKSNSSTIDNPVSVRQESESDPTIESNSRPDDPQKRLATQPAAKPSVDKRAEPTSPKIISLFDGKSLEGWEQTQFGGQGEASVIDGAILLEPGFPLTGVHSLKSDLPTANYEIFVEARKVDGIDFFCCLTFPVNDSHCSFIVGGWAGTVVGLSMIDDQDASQNETRKSMKFESGQWYSIRTKVLADRIQCWIDKELVVDQNIVGRKISLRNETLLCRPLGICTFETKAEIRKMELHVLESETPRPRSDAADKND